MNKSIVVVLLMVMFGCIGCASVTPRKVYPPGEDAGAVVLVPGEEVEVEGFIDGVREVATQKKSNAVANLMQQQNTSSLWHQREQEAALSGKVIESPDGRQDGAKPAILINRNRYRARTISYESSAHGSTGHSVTLAPNSSTVVYLRGETYLMGVSDERGRQILIQLNASVDDETRALVQYKPAYIFPVKVYAFPKWEWEGHRYFALLSID